MERCRTQTEDILASLSLLCDGNEIEKDKIIHSPVSMYESKLKWFLQMNKIKEKQNKQPQQQPARKPKHKSGGL